MSDELRIIKPIIEEEGFATQLIEASNLVPLDALLIFIDSDSISNKRNVLIVNIIPQLEQQLEGLNLTQFYFELAKNILPNKNKISELLYATSVINTKCPIGGFSLDTERNVLFFKYSLIQDFRDETNKYKELAQTIWMIDYVLDLFQKVFTQIIEKNCTTREALQNNNLTHLIKA